MEGAALLQSCAAHHDMHDVKHRPEMGQKHFLKLNPDNGLVYSTVYLIALWLVNGQCQMLLLPPEIP